MNRHISKHFHDRRIELYVEIRVYLKCIMHILINKHSQKRTACLSIQFKWDKWIVKDNPKQLLKLLGVSIPNELRCFLDCLCDVREIVYNTINDGDELSEHDFRKYRSQIQTHDLLWKRSGDEQNNDVFKKMNGEISRYRDGKSTDRERENHIRFMESIPVNGLRFTAGKAEAAAAATAAATAAAAAAATAPPPPPPQSPQPTSPPLEPFAEELQTVKDHWHQLEQKLKDEIIKAMNDRNITAQRDAVLKNVMENGIREMTEIYEQTFSIISSVARVSRTMIESLDAIHLSKIQTLKDQTVHWLNDKTVDMDIQLTGAMERIRNQIQTAGRVPFIDRNDPRKA